MCSEGAEKPKIQYDKCEHEVESLLINFSFSIGSLAVLVCDTFRVVIDEISRNCSIILQLGVAFVFVESMWDCQV